MIHNGPIITGPRLRLRPVLPADLPFLEALWNDGRVMHYVGFPDGLGVTPEKMAAWWDGCHRWTATHLIIETRAGIPIGETGWGFSGDPGLLECKLVVEAWGEGYATEALGALIDYVWRRTTVPHVSVTPHRRNEPARRLYRRLGFGPAPIPDGLGWDEDGPCDYWALHRDGDPPRPRTLIFDWGGVLMRTMDDSGRRAWERRLRLPDGGADRAVFGNQAWHEVQLGRLSVEETWRAIGAPLGLEGDDLAEFRRDFWGGDRLNEDLVAHIADWRAAGHPVALLSNYHHGLEALLDAQGVRHLFHPIVISAHEGIMKPAAWLYWRTLNRMGLAPTEALFVDDAAENIAGARRVGLHAVHFRDTEEAVAAIERTLA
jgi:FMN phosphatase YigB (HAD superfamily)/RimJ/RimL family protein N-acetyltransferase